MRSASWLAAITRTPAASRTPNNISRRSPKPTGCCPTRPNGPATTRTGPPAWPRPPRKTCGVGSTSPMFLGRAQPRSAACSSGCSGRRRRAHWTMRTCTSTSRSPWARSWRVGSERSLSAAPGPASSARAADPAPGRLRAAARSAPEPASWPWPAGSARCWSGRWPGARIARAGDTSPISRAQPATPAAGPCTRGRSPSGSRPASRTVRCCGWPGAECPVRCPAARRVMRT
jgi:hypothetical protein